MITQARFRKALGNFCTGVTVVTALRERSLRSEQSNTERPTADYSELARSGRDAVVRDAEPVGFACQSFAALSLDPPLVLFCPGRTSHTWPHIEAHGHFCVNVLSHSQQDVSATFGRAGADKFSCVPWAPAPSGAPILAGALTWLDCAIEDVHEGGDHYIVVGRVTTLGDQRDARPLLFHRGAYAVTEPAEPTPGILDNLITWSQHDDWI